MNDNQPTYRELEIEVQEARDQILTLYRHEADAIVGGQGVSLVRTREIEKTLNEARQRLEQQYTGQSEELKKAKKKLREVLDQNAKMVQELEERELALHQKAKDLRKLSLQLGQAEERERRRLAGILHDDIQQLMAGAKFHLGILARRIKGDAAASEKAKNLNSILKEAMEKSRSLSHELSPALLHQNDLGEMLRWLSDHVETRQGLAVEVVSGRVRLGSDALKLFFYKAVQELLFNVAKHAAVDRACIRVRRRGRYVCVLISDRGRGFDPKAISGSGGFGLSSICERVRLLGGRMRIQSAVGAGSRFVIAVPVSEPAPSEQQNAQPDAASNNRVEVSGDSPQPSAAGLLRILIADDHQIVREGLASLISDEADLELVGQASNGYEAVDLTRRLRPDVVIMDISMAGMDGEEATRRIKSQMPETRVVMLSMFPESQQVQRICSPGADAHLCKTDPSEQLLEAVRRRGGEMSPFRSPEKQNIGH